jgi:hypothetical protein
MIDEHFPYVRPGANPFLVASEGAACRQLLAKRRAEDRPRGETAVRHPQQVSDVRRDPAMRRQVQDEQPADRSPCALVLQGLPQVSVLDRDLGRVGELALDLDSEFQAVSHDDQDVAATSS